MRLILGAVCGLLAGLLSAGAGYAQGKAMSFEALKQTALTTAYLDSVYQSAIHADTTQAVFRSDQDQELLIRAYQQLLQDFGNFLYQHDFKWDKPVRSFNRIYFNPEGKIDYFLYHFSGTDMPPARMQEFERLLQLFIQDYQVPLKAPRPFAQCSPAIYRPAAVPEHTK